MYEKIRILTSMPRQVPRPTDSELRILAILWQLGPSSVRQVHARCEKGTGYTTILKFMQLMTEKGLLKRAKQGKLHIYRPAVAQEHTQKHLLDELLHRAFGGSLRKLLVAALAGRKSSTKDLDEIRRLIDQAQSGKSDPSSQKGGPS
jgi:predicted transcriptional regulator